MEPLESVVPPLENDVPLTAIPEAPEVAELFSGEFIDTVLSLPGDP